MKARLLFISPTSPWPATNGSRLRIDHFLRALSQDYEVTLLCLGSRPDDLPAEYEAMCHAVIYSGRQQKKVSAVLKWCFSSLPYRHVKNTSPAFARTLKDLLREKSFDMVWCNFLDMLYYLEPCSDLIDRARTRIILDQHNVDSHWYQSFSDSRNRLVRLFGAINVRRLAGLEKQQYELVDIVVSVSREDAEFTRQHLTDKKVIVAHNGISEELARQPVNEKKPANGQTILFCGSMDVLMNQDAVLHFVRDIFPLVQKQQADCRLVVVGRNPPAFIRQLDNQKTIIVTGTVESVAPYYHQADVAISPFRYGAGSKLKNIEAMLMRVPLVSTRIGYTGLEGTPGKDFILCDDAGHFADAVCRLLKQRPDDMIESAYQLARAHYLWPQITTRALREIQDSSLSR